MEWFKKEAAYERTYRSGSACRNLWKYIPSSIYSAVADCAVDSDGYWIYLNDGWTAYDHGSDCGIIHEFTVADIKLAIKTIAHA